MLSSTKVFACLTSLSVLLVGCFFLTVQYQDFLEPLVVNKKISLVGRVHQECSSLHKIDSYKAKCMYLKRYSPCVSQGYIDYLYHFYCTLGSIPFLGYTLLFLWILVLFYLLGSTASDYFCTSLESLSKFLKLSPAIAGVTLLSLGNGAPDVFASFVSFMGSRSSEIGLNTVVGGASFVSCFVVGVISFLLRNENVRVVRIDFIRDVCFYLMVVGILAVVLIKGEIVLCGAVGFSSVYLVYVLVVYVSHRFSMSYGGDHGVRGVDSGKGNDLVTPILGTGHEEIECMEQGGIEGDKRVETKGNCLSLRWLMIYRVVFGILKVPLDLPRKLTIPVVSHESWSKPFAITSVALAPILLAALWIPHSYLTFQINLVAYLVVILVGIALGVLTYLKTEDSMPPRKYLCPWLAGGFLMSVTWTYIAAQELVGSLISLGYILQISQATLGLTVLAWGNSIGDLITNATMALKGGTEGAQIAISACYAGPIFNILFGLGLSFVGSCWYGYPMSLIVVRDDFYLLETLAFLAIGLLWALFVVPLRKMRLDGTLGIGLLMVYFTSLSVRVISDPTMG